MDERTFNLNVPGDCVRPSAAGNFGKADERGRGAGVTWLVMGVGEIVSGLKTVNEGGIRPHAPKT